MLLQRQTRLLGCTSRRFSRQFAAAAALEHYSLLGCSPSATPEELKKAFNRLAKQQHPDLNPDDKNAHHKFIKLKEAYELCAAQEESTSTADSAFGPVAKYATLLRRAGNAQAAWAVWRLLKADKKVALVDQAVVELMLRAASQNGTHLAFLDELLDSGLLSSRSEAVHGYNYIFDAFSGAGLFKGDAALLVRAIDHMEQRTIQPNKRTYELLQGVYCKYNNEANRRVCRWFEDHRQQQSRGRAGAGGGGGGGGGGGWCCVQ